ncbi:FAD-dependent oxidoreductase [Oceaniovalibus sp. ACAM 378]|uniref:flavin monoamine oxidase family protein n=1 Tax=Oceaniovalibus sp. ACAM 378 TaxID=2599923 RepID=UPI0011DB0E2A|nr:FAD-dependent oxidoreductase [Oceaniovalibus sp. ACAM 378]TYB84027.1 NAD(P)-binding protein [Oceaniovalibus sp. ACAM 378]
MKTLIVGGGLSGLALAEALESQGHDYLLLEARPRFGGRILTQHHGGGYFDMGPAWFWAGQPRIAALIARMNLQKFNQFADGVLTFEDEQGHVQRGQGFSSMEGSWRLKGGLGMLTTALENRLPDHRKRLDAPVMKLQMSENRSTATLSDGEEIGADQVVLALPPRVAEQIAFSPALPDKAVLAMQGIATWMAGQAKAVAVYDTPFWRNEGLSGDAMSRKGPMVEIHDASPAAGGPYALFGFIGVPPQGRADEHLFRVHLHAQLSRLFGPQAAEPKQLYIKDWAFDRYTSTEADKAPLYAHPTYGLPHVMTNLWNNRLHFAGTEVAPTFGGYIEGALEAAENVLNTLDLQRLT